MEILTHGDSDEPGVWRAAKATDGVVIDIDSGESVGRGFAMPHSPRLAMGRLWVLNSGVCQLGPDRVECDRVSSEILKTCPVLFDDLQEVRCLEKWLWSQTSAPLRSLGERQGVSPPRVSYTTPNSSCHGVSRLEGLLPHRSFSPKPHKSGTGTTDEQRSDQKPCRQRCLVFDIQI